MRELTLIKTAPLTIILIVLCVVFYVPDLLHMDLGSYMAVRAGGMASAPWTLVTAMFAHGSLEHLACNMISLWYMGSLLENMQGTPRFAVVYFASGIAGNVAYSMFGTGSAVGASGAIFGLLGACALLLFAMRSNPAAKSMLSGMAGMLAVNIFNSFLPGIALEAHFGGLVAGVVVEAIMLITLRGELDARHAALGLAGGSGQAPVQAAPDAQGFAHDAEQGFAQPDDDSMLMAPDSAQSPRPRKTVSTVVAIVASLALTASAFGMLAFTQLGIGAPVRTLGAESSGATSPDVQSDVQWAGNDTYGYVRLPKSWQRAATSSNDSSISYYESVANGDQDAPPVNSLTFLETAGSFADIEASWRDVFSNSEYNAEIGVERATANGIDIHIASATYKKDGTETTEVAYYLGKKPSSDKAVVITTYCVGNDIHKFDDIIATYVRSKTS